MRSFNYIRLSLALLLIFAFLSSESNARSSIVTSFLQSIDQQASVVSAPVIESTFPKDNSTDIPVDSPVKLYFDHGIAGYLLHNISIEDEDGEEVNGLDYSVIDGSIIAVYHQDFEYETTYTVILPASAVKNDKGDSNSLFSFSFTTVEEPSPPEVETTSPEDGESGVDTSQELKIEFNEQVRIINADRFVITNSKGAFVDNVEPYLQIAEKSTGTEEITSTIVRIDHDELEENERYYAGIAPGAVKNDAGKENTLHYWYFTTGSSAKPSVVETDPENKETEVGPDKTIKIYFSEAIYAKDLSAIRIFDSFENPVDNIEAFIPGLIATKADEVSSTSGNSIEITHDNFDPGTEYYVEIPKNTVVNRDEIGNDFYSWSFSTAGSDPPESQTLVPVDDADDIPVDTEISVTFDQAITVSNLAGIKLYDSFENEVSDVSSNLSGKKITISHPGLKPGTSYFVLVPKNTVKNSNSVGNDFFRWGFSTIAANAPEIMEVNPSDEATGVALDESVSVVFNEEIYSLDLSDVSIFDSDENEVTGLSVSINENELNIRHNDFIHDETYTVLVSDNVVENESGIANKSVSWTFTTELEDLSLLATIPEDKAVGIATDGEISAEFNQKLLGLNLDAIVILNSEGAPLPNVSADINEEILKVSHPGFEKGKLYTVSIPEGTVGNLEEDPNSDISWSFTTILPAPAVESREPAENISGASVSTEISVTFDQEITAVDLSGILISDAQENNIGGVSASLDGHTFRIDHDDFEHDKTYIVTVPANVVENKDGVGNTEISWSFSTVLTSPEITSTVPADGASSVFVDSNVSATFNQQVAGADLTGILILNSQGNAVEEITVGLNGNTIHIFHNDFIHNEIYTVHIPAGSVQNTGEVFNEEFSWSFSTIMEAPGVVNQSPEDGSNSVPTDATVHVTFDQEVFEKDLSAIDIKDTEGNAVSAVSHLLNGNSISIDHENLDHSKKYTVQVPANVVENEDGVGNSAFSWSFSTILSLPEVISTIPEDGDSAIPIDSEISIVLNQEAVDIHVSGFKVTDSQGTEVDGLFIEADGNTLSLRHDNFEHGEIYTVNISAGALENSDGLQNEFYSWKFTTLLAAPEIVTIQPQQGASEVAIDAEVNLVYNQNVSAVDLSGIRILDSDENEVSGVSATLGENRISISHDDFANNEGYIIIIPEGVVANADGIGNEEYAWNFSTILSIPKILSFSPAEGATGVALNARVNLTFNQEVKASKLQDISIIDSEDNQVSGIISELNGSSVSISHEGFMHGEIYEVSIPEGIVVNTDQVGNESFSWSFTTILSTPAATEFTPEDGDTAVETNAMVQIIFDQDILEADFTDIEITDEEGQRISGVSASIHANTLEIEHDDFPNGKTITVFIPGNVVKNSDGVGNSEMSWNFTTILSPPSVISTIPFDKADAVSVNTEISVTFDQNVTAGDLSGISVKDETGNILNNIAGSPDGNILRLNHDEFDHNSTFTVTIPRGAVINADDIVNEAISWSFKTVLIISESVSVQVSRTFSDASSSADYRLMALPGEINEPLTNVLPGEPNVNWQAFWDDGSDQDFLVRFDGSETFNLSPGNGFWITSINDLEYNQSFSTVSLNESNQAAISLHQGWNIISNPLDIDVAWTEIENLNGIDLQPVWGFEEMFESTTVFCSAKEGEAFYFLNDSDLDQLLIPYIEINHSAKQKEDTSRRLRLSLIRNGRETSVSELKLVDSETDLKPDVISPPAGFEAASLRFTADEHSIRRNSLARIYRKKETEGQKFDMLLTSPGSKKITIKVDGWNTELFDELVFLNKETGNTYYVEQGKELTIKPEKEVIPLLLMMGTAEYVNSEQETYLPEKIELLPNYPNPFNPATTISFSIPEQSQVQLKIYDMLGRKVATLINNEVKSAGLHSIKFDASQNASGIYIAVVEIGHERFLQKMLLMK